MNADNNNNNDYRFARRLALVILLVLACSVTHANCKRVKKSDKTENTDQNDQDETKNTMAIVATTIQHCVDERTMNNKSFKMVLDDLYESTSKPEIETLIEKFTTKVNNIRNQYLDDMKILKRMQSINGGKKKK